MSRGDHPDKTRALLRLGVRTPLDAHLQTVEEAHLLRVLAVCDGNRSLAADVLGLERRTLQRRLKGIERARLQAIEAPPVRKPSPAARTESAASAEAPVRARRGPTPRIDGALVLTLRARGLHWA